MASSKPGNDNEMDYEEHKRTYQLFIRLTKISTIVVVLILILMAIFLL
jgi:hypothetical protein